MLQRLEERAMRSFDRLEKDGEIYYKPQSRFNRIDWSEEDMNEFFEISDTLLELDAEGNPNVRNFDKTDETEMLRRWTDKSRFIAATRQFDDLKSQLKAAKKMREEIVKPSAAAWRLSRHDLLTVALRGSKVIPVASTRQPPLQDGEEAHSSILLDPRSGGDGLHFAIAQNGIPNYAEANDDTLLDWMILRHDNLPKNHTGSLMSTSDQGEIQDALRNATLLVELRRLVTVGLNQGLSLRNDDPSASPANIIRDFCIRLLGSSSARSAELAQALTFVGNLLLRTKASDPGACAELWPLSMQLASNHSLSAFMGHLRLGLDESRAIASLANAFELHQIMVDVSMHIHEMEKGWDLSEAATRQAFLQLLTGASPVLSPHSLRSLIFTHDTNSHEGSQQLLLLYQDYLVLLGQVGAIRSLWAEWNFSAEEIAERTASSESEASSNKNYIAGAILSAADLALRNPNLDTSSYQLAADWQSCAALDFHAIGAEKQTPDSGIMAPAKVDSGRLDAALDGPLREWLETLHPLR